MKTKRMLLTLIVATLLLSLTPISSGTLAGHFTFVSQQDDGDSYFGVHSDNQFIYVACGAQGLRIYNKTSNLLLDTVYDGGYYKDVFSFGNFIFVACAGAGLYCYWFDYTDDLNYVLSLNDTTYDVIYDDYYIVYVDLTGTYVYAGCGGEGILAYTYVDDGTLTLAGQTYDGGGHYSGGIISNSTYIFVATYIDLYVYTFDGANFNVIGSISEVFDIYDVTIDTFSNYIYTGTSNGTHVYTFDGIDFNDEYFRQDIFGDDYDHVWLNDTLVFFSAQNQGILCYSLYNGTDMAFLDNEIPAGIVGYAVGGDETYVYLTAWDDGLFFYTFDITTPGTINPPTVTTIDPPTGIGLNNATLPGLLTNDGGETCSVWFQYGTTYPYSHASSHQTKTTGQSFNINIAGLTQNTAYSYRAVAQNSNGTTYGANQSFTTLSSSGVQVNWTGIFDSIGRMFTGGEYYDSNGVHHSVTGIFGGGQDTRALLGVFIFAILFLLTTIWGLGILIGSVAIIPSVFAVMNYIPGLGIIVAIVAGLLFGLGLNRIIRR